MSLSLHYPSAYKANKAIVCTLNITKNGSLVHKKQNDFCSNEMRHEYSRHLKSSQLIRFNLVACTNTLDHTVLLSYRVLKEDFQEDTYSENKIDVQIDVLPFLYTHLKESSKNISIGCRLRLCVKTFEILQATCFGKSKTKMRCI